MSKPSQIDPWSPEGAQECSQRLPRGFSGRPRGSPRGPIVVSWSPQGGPREPQGSSKATQGLPEAPPRAENRIKNAPKIDFEADVGSEPHSKPISDRFFFEVVTKIDLRIDGELRRKVSSKLPSINQEVLQKSWFYRGRTTLFVMLTKKQTRQRNTRNRRNHHRKHHRKATCAKLLGALVSKPIWVPKSMPNHSKIDQFSTQINPISTSANNFESSSSVQVQAKIPPIIG